MRARFVVVAMLVGRTAFAQAPGEVQPVAPPQAIVCADCLSVMEHRWSLSASLAATGIQDKDGSDKANFGGAEIAVGFRATPHLELRLQLAAAHQNAEANDSDMDLDSFALAIRYRFLPFQHFNVYAHAALGSTTLAQDAQRNTASRGMFQLGVGGEYRFDHFAIDFQLRAVAIGQQNAPNGVPIDPAIRLTGPLSGGQALLGATYYF
jgi:hypothetical protein